MTGADYTGGKRNVSRTRSRSSTWRVQQNHFGRRRLGILSQALINGTHTQKENTSAGISGILLEHAQREFSRSPAISNLAHQTGAAGAFTFKLDPPLPAGPSRTGSKVTLPNSSATNVLDSNPSRRVEINRILEFSRTVGLCNYSTSPRQSVLASPASCIDSRPGVGVGRATSLTRTVQRRDTPRRRNQNIVSAMSGSSGITRLNSVREESSFSQQVRERETDLVCVGPASDDEYLESWISQSPAHPINSFEAQLGQDEGSAGLSERSLYPAGPSTPSLDRLEFPTSPLSPSSLLLSGTTYESHLSLCQTPHGTETTALDFDNTSLLSIVGGSCRDGSSSRSGRCRHIAPDLASASPVQRRPRSGLAHKVSTPLPSSSKADVISDLLMRDDPWNEIGKILGLPPILTADATYFDNIRSLDALSRERIATQAPSRSSSPVNGREHSDTVRDDGTWSRSVRSDGDILVRPDSSRHWFSRDDSSRIPPPLCCRDSPEKRVLSPSPSVPSIRGAHSPNCAESHSPSLSTSRNVIVPSEAPRSLLEPQPRLVSPRLPEGPLTPRRPTQLPPKHLKSPKTSISCSPGVESTPWNTIGFDIAELISNLSRTRSTGSQRPKLECPDLFLDEDSLEGDF